MRELRQTIKNEIKLRNNILKLHQKGLISQLDVDVYLDTIRDSKKHKKVVEELDKIIRLASCVFNPLESKDSLYDFFEGKEVNEK